MIDITITCISGFNLLKYYNLSMKKKKPTIYYNKEFPTRDELIC